MKETVIRTLRGVPMANIKKILNSNTGAALVMTLVTFMIMTMLTFSVLYMNTTNTKQVISQKDYYRAYYLAYSGVEIAYSALLMDGGSLLNQYKISVKSDSESGIVFGDGKIDVSISSDSAKKITIISTGTLDSNGRSVTLTASFLADYPTIMKWD